MVNTESLKGYIGEMKYKMEKTDGGGIRNTCTSAIKEGPSRKL